MRWLAAFSIRNGVLVHMLVLGLVLMGTFAYTQLPRQLMSEMSFNWVFVRVDYPGVPPDDLEQLVAIPVEEQIRNVDGVSSVTNRSKEGFTFFSVKFESLSDDEFDGAYQEIKDAVAVVRLPEEAEEPVFVNFSSADFVPMISLVLAGEMEQDELFNVAERLEEEIEAIDGISKVDLGGVQERQIWVEVDPDLLHAASLSIDQVVRALAASNVSIPGGLLTVGSSDYVLRTTNQFDAVAAIADVVLGASPGGGAITVGDVASIEDLWEEAAVRARYENDPAVTLTIAKKPAGNSLELSRQIRELADQWNLRLEGRGRVAVTGDSSKQIASMLGDLQINALVGMVFVVLVLWVALGLRNALLTALGIPLAFLATFIFMWWSGASLDGNSLFGLVLVLGIIVDDAIVLVENTARHAAMGKDRKTAIIDGVSEVSVPVIAAILTTIAAFLPLMLMPGLMGKFMRIIPVVVSMALIASLVEALISLPAHLYDWGEKDPSKLHSRDAAVDRIARPYVRALEFLTRARLPKPADARGLTRLLTWLVPAANLFAVLITALLGLAIIPGALFVVFGPVGAALGGIVPVVGLLGLGGLALTRGTFFRTARDLFDRARHARFTIFGAVYLLMVPLALGIASQVDLDLFGGEEIPQFFVHVRLPEGTSLEQTDAVMSEMDRLARSTVPAEDLVSVTTHAGFLMTETEWFFKGNYGQLDIQLTEPKTRDNTLDDLMALLRPVLARVPGPDSVELVPVNSGPPAGGDVELKLQGPDLARLDQLSEVVRAELGQVRGVEDIRDDYLLGKKELRVTVDPERAALYGVTEAQVGLALRAAYDGAEATRYQDDGDDVPVLVRYPREARRDLDWLERTMVQTASGGLVPFREVAEISVGRSIDAVRRYQGARTITMTANVDKTKNTAINAVTETKARLADFSERFPGYRIDYTGEFQEFQRSLEALGFLSVVGLLLVYMILGTQFRSFLQPVIIIGFTFPGAMFGSAVALLVTGTPLSILTMYGLVALLGIVVNDSLVFISFINAERERGLPVNEAILSAGRLRLRPILLTTITTVFGLLPMAIGIGGKSGVWAPLATTIAFGLVFATATTLLVIPPVYRVFVDLVELATQGLGARPDETGEQSAAASATPSALAANPAGSPS